MRCSRARKSVCERFTKKPCRLSETRVPLYFVESVQSYSVPNARSAFDDSSAAQVRRTVWNIYGMILRLESFPCKHIQSICIAKCLTSAKWNTESFHLKWNFTHSLANVIGSAQRLGEPRCSFAWRCDFGSLNDRAFDDRIEICILATNRESYKPSIAKSFTDIETLVTGFTGFTGIYWFETLSRGSAEDLKHWLYDQPKVKNIGLRIG